MAQVLEELKDGVVVKFTHEEFQELQREAEFDEDDISTYDIVFDPPMNPAELLNAFK